MYFSREKLTKMLVFVSTLAFCVATISVILNGVNQFKVGSQLASISQVSNLAHVLVRQQANLFSLMLMKNTKTDELVEALDSFSKEEFVLDANLYSATGELLAQSQNSMALKERIGQKNTQQIVEPIYSSNGVEGFLRVTFDAKYAQSTKSKINQMFHRLYGEIIIVFLVGVLFAGSLHYFFSQYHRSRVHVAEKAPMPSNKATQSMSKLFHQRRRRVR